MCRFFGLMMRVNSNCISFQRVNSSTTLPMFILCFHMAIHNTSMRANTISSTGFILSFYAAIHYTSMQANTMNRFSYIHSFQTVIHYITGIAENCLHASKHTVINLAPLSLTKATRCCRKSTLFESRNVLRRLHQTTKLKEHLLLFGFVVRQI